MDGFRQLIGNAASDESGFRAFIGSFLSRYRLAHEPAPAEQELAPPALRQALSGGAQLRHNPWTRLLWLKTDGGAMLFAAGEEFQLFSGTCAEVLS